MPSPSRTRSAAAGHAGTASPRVPPTLAALFRTRHRKNILTAFKRYQPIEIQLAVLECIAAGDTELPTFLLSMDERSSRVYHRLCWTCIAQVESLSLFRELIVKAPRSSLYLLLASLADSGNTPRLFLAARDMSPSKADLFLATCHATEEGIQQLKEIGAPTEMPIVRENFEDSPLGRATRADDRIALKNLLQKMTDMGVDPAQWLARNRKQMPTWAYRTLKSAYNTMLDPSGTRGAPV